MLQPEILFVDDEPDILDLGALLLREAGYSVTTAANSDIAMIFLEQGLTFRLLVTDIVLPGLLDGFALAHRARMLLPRLKVIYATGFGGVARVRSKGGAPYGQLLSKPWKSEMLLDLVAAALPQRAVAPAILR